MTKPERNEAGGRFAPGPPAPLARQGRPHTRCEVWGRFPGGSAVGLDTPAAGEFFVAGVDLPTQMAATANATSLPGRTEGSGGQTVQSVLSSELN